MDDNELHALRERVSHLESLISPITDGSVSGNDVVAAILAITDITDDEFCSSDRVAASGFWLPEARIAVVGFLREVLNMPLSTIGQYTSCQVSSDRHRLSMWSEMDREDRDEWIARIWAQVRNARSKK